MQFALPMAIRANAVYKAERKVVIPHSKLAQAHHVLYPGVLKMYSKYAPSLPPRETLLRYDDAVSASGRFGTDAFWRFHRLYCFSCYDLSLSMTDAKEPVK